jgi:S-adenosylmethionine:tRNA ribosyltransferase-isomerase
MTNFHLPKSTLFMLICAFVGKDKAHEIYNYAISQQYRFYSYGDSSLLFKSS